MGDPPPLTALSEQERAVALERFRAPAAAPGGGRAADPRGPGRGDRAAHRRALGAALPRARAGRAGPAAARRSRARRAFPPSWSA